MRSTNEEGHKNNPSDEKRSPKEKEKEHWNEMDVKREKKSDLTWMQTRAGTRQEGKTYSDWV